MLTLPKNAPPAYHVLMKPTGAVCILDCKYCFFLSKEMLYPGSRFRMADDLLETYLRQLLQSHAGPEVTVAWQGGEPTLMGLDFFKQHNFLVGLSVDGPCPLHDTYRANLLRRGRYADEAMQIMAAEEAVLQAAFAWGTGHDPCPCGSELKYRRCHGLWEVPPVELSSN